MASAPSKLYADDVSLVVVLVDTNPFFWRASSLSFSQFLSHVLAFLNAILTLNQLNQVVVIATGYNSCNYIFDSSSDLNQSFENGRMPVMCSSLLQKLEEFLIKDEQLSKEVPEGRIKSSLLSGSLSMALCYIQRVFRSGALHPHPRILCLQGSPDGPEQYVLFNILSVIYSFLLWLLDSNKGFLLFRYVAIMNAIFSAQRSMVPIDSCYMGAQNSAFLQQASYITGGVHHKPQHLDGLFQYLMTIFATDLHSRSFLHLPKPVGVDFRASCFCHKNTIDMGYICSVCLSIFCKHHKKCSTCGSVFGQAQSEAASASDKKRKTPET
ncbi:RNA polymerase II transcription factor B subunit 4 isoform X1 [Herrania umbratica]|uniref:General transcription and DNA repair factor IIH subunit TFB4 n=1 Tax=Herrania umbratica TaxID=108875 RepID=A0A6J1ABP5_9ROSI|nr:RNA polymerase II transcription factor B subunit 4 isoform X1 [Herrania umbratica]